MSLNSCHVSSALSGCLVSPVFGPFSRSDKASQMSNEMTPSLKQPVPHVLVL